MNPPDILGLRVITNIKPSMLKLNLCHPAVSPGFESLCHVFHIFRCLEIEPIIEG